MNKPTKTTKPHITLLLLTKNESDNIKKHFDWLSKCPAINEIICIDDNSTDNTISSVKALASTNLKVKVFNHSLNSNFSAQRAFGISHSSNDWILWLDPDEKPNKEMIEYINHIDTCQCVYLFKRQDIFLGHLLKYGETGNIFLPRLFNKNHGKFIYAVHETWQSSQPSCQGRGVITHFSHPIFYSFLHKINFYTDIKSQELYDQKVPVNLFQIILYPKAKFIQNYFFKLGFLDGTPGIIMALSMSFHSFLVRAKLWHLYQK